MMIFRRVWELVRNRWLVVPGTICARIDGCWRQRGGGADADEVYILGLDIMDPYLDSDGCVWDRVPYGDGIGGMCFNFSSLISTARENTCYVGKVIDVFL